MGLFRHSSGRAHPSPILRPSLAHGSPGVLRRARAPPRRYTPRMKRASFASLTFLLVACSTTSGTTEPAPAPTPPKPAANGTVEAFQEVTAMPTPRGNHCAVAVEGWLVVIGGNYKPAGKEDFVTTDQIHAAKIGEDGTLGAWQAAGKTPLPVSSCTVAADGKDIYLLDGIYENEAAHAPRTVRRATLGADGTLGAWQEAGTLPTGVRVLYSAADVSKGALRAFHVRLPDDGDAVSFVRTPIASGGANAWQESKWLTGFRGHPQYAFAETPAGAFLYAFGGYAGANKGNAMLATGAGAKLDEAGMPGAAFPVRDLPRPIGFGEAVAVDRWLFLVGGKESIFPTEACKTCATARADILAAPIADDGTLGEWKTVATMPQGRSAHTVVVSGDHLYVIGGAFDAGGVTTVWSARVRF